MPIRRSDLILEAAELLTTGEKSAEKCGVRPLKSRRCGYDVTTMRVAAPEDAAALGKPIGRYVTVDLRPYFQRESGFFARGVACLQGELTALLPSREKSRSILVVGLGNRALTADAIGPMALDSLLITRHMVRDLPRQFETFTPVEAFAPGVLASTGMETLELVRAVVRETCPAAVIAVDALAARNRERLCATVQLSDTGLIPGSGVGNHRRALNEETLGIPVIALGIPTVIDASDLGDTENGEPLFVTPRDIDSRMRELGRLVGFGVTLALQPSLTIEDVAGLLG